jgi:hypothetical protein
MRRSAWELARVRLLGGPHDDVTSRIGIDDSAAIYPLGYYFECPPKHREMPKVAAFHGWLRVEAAKHGPAMKRSDRLVDGYMEEYRARGIGQATINHTVARLDRWGRG